MDQALRQPPFGAALYPPTVSPPAKPLPLSRFLFRFLDNPLASVPKVAYEQPLTVLETGAGIKIVWVSGPGLVADILIKRPDALDKSTMEKRVFHRAVGDSVLTADVPDWRWQRRTLAPPFRHGDVLAYVPTIAEVAEETAQAWRTSQAGPSVRQIDDEMVEATFQVIARTMLAGGASADTRNLIADTNAYLSGVPWEMAWDIFKLPHWLPSPGSIRMARAAPRLRKSIANIISQRRASGVAPNDLIDRLLAAENPETGAPMDDTAMINNLLTLLEAGHETTARALTFTLYLLARAPDWQKRVHDEVREVAGSGQITAEHVDKLVVTRMVLEEALRLYPPAPVLARRVTKPTTIGTIPVSPGDQVVVPIYAIHRHRMLWEDPDRFDPERFAPQRRAEIPRTQFMPFGAGQRICLGMSFAMIEAQVMLAAFVRAAAFSCDANLNPEPISRVTLRPKGGMPLHVAPR